MDEKKMKYKVIGATPVAARLPQLTDRNIAFVEEALKTLSCNSRPPETAAKPAGGEDG